MTTLNEMFRIGMDRTIPELLPMPPGKILNVGAGNKKISGTIPVDYPAWNADSAPLPFEDDSVSGIHTYHFLEHCAKPVSVLLEFQRVLIDGGVVNLVVPYYNSQMQFQDLDHKCSFNEESFRVLFRNRYYDKNRIEWKLQVNTCIIIGLVARNLCLLAQLVKRE